MNRRALLAGAGATLAAPIARGQAGAIPVVATFSILADLVREVGGGRLAVASLIGPDAAAHEFEPSPADAARLARARLVVANGLGFEGWLDRLVRASGTRAPVVLAAGRVTPRRAEGTSDPHAFQVVANVKLYVAAIAEGLAAADPDGREAYSGAAARYAGALDALDDDIRRTLAPIPAERRRAITNHDAFGYFGAAYGIAFIAPRGVASDADVSARDIARIVRQVRAERIPAVFLENVTDPRQMDRIAAESGARIGGRLYSDALSRPDGPAPTYAAMMRLNAQTLAAALAP